MLVSVCLQNAGLGFSSGPKASAAQILCQSWNCGMHLQYFYNVTLKNSLLCFREFLTFWFLLKYGYAKVGQCFALWSFCASWN